MGWEDGEHLDVCQNIETGLRAEYERNRTLTDSKVIYALDMAKIAVKQANGFAKNEKVILDEDTKGIIEWCLSVGNERIATMGDITLKEYLNRIDKIKRSVKRHSEYGRRGYYEFIKNYVPPPEYGDEAEEEFMEPGNPELKKAILQVVANQVRSNDPPETRQTLERLQQEGISQEDARIYIGQAVAVEIWDTMKNHKPFNLERYIRNLKNLPAEPKE